MNQPIVLQERRMILWSTSLTMSDFLCIPLKYLKVSNWIIEAAIFADANLRMVIALF